MRTCHIVQTRGSSSASAFPVLGCWAFTTTAMKGTCSASCARSFVGLSPTTTKKEERAGMLSRKDAMRPTSQSKVPENKIAGLQSASCSLLPSFLAKSQGKCDSGWVTKSSNGIDWEMPKSSKNWKPTTDVLFPTELGVSTGSGNWCFLNLSKISPWRIFCTGLGRWLSS